MKKREDSFRHDTDEISGKAFDLRIARRMLTYVRPYRGLFAISVVTVTAIVFLELLQGELIKRVIDGPLAEAVSSGEGLAAWEEVAGIVAMWAGGVALLALSSAVLGVLQVRWINRVAQGAMRDLRVQVFRHVQHQSLRFFDRNPVGRLVTRVVHDVEALADLLTSGLDAIFRDVFLLGGIVIWLFATDARLAAVSLVVVPPLIVVTHFFRMASRRAFRRVRERLAVVNSRIQESISGLRVIQAFVQEAKCRRRFEARDRELADAHLSTVANFALFFPVVELLAVIGKATVVWWGARSIVATELSFGELTQFLFYLEMFFRPIRQISERFNILQSSMASAERLFRLLDRPSDLVSPEDAVPVERLRGEVELRDVTFGYSDDRPVLRDIGFHVKPGETVALVGATGAGKTTVASLVTRLYDVQEGAVLVDGRDVREHELRALRRGVTVVPQDVFLFAGTVAENLRMGDPSLTREQMLAACEAVGADRVLARLPGGLDGEVGERGGRLSVGERQLLALARALAQDPAVLVLDEATSSVDSETEHLIEKALERLQKGRTTLVIAHRLSTVRRADRILVFHHGELREQGDHAELVKQDGIYATLHRLQFAA
jgi:ATP-binding cassette subfamily B protein